MRYERPNLSIQFSFDFRKMEDKDRNLNLESYIFIMLSIQLKDENFDNYGNIDNLILQKYEGNIHINFDTIIN